MIILTSALAVTAAAHSEPELKVVSEGAYSLGGAQQFVLHSARVGRDFLVVVTPPPTASVLDGSLPSHQRSANQKYPAVYALDAGWGIAGPLAQMMAQTQIMAPAYVISIGYPAGQTDPRNVDLLHRTFIDSGQTYGVEWVVGGYQLPDGRIITIRRGGARIFARVTGMPGESELLAETSRRFFIPGGFDVLYTFEGPTDSQASSLLVRVNGTESRAMRKTTP